MKLLVTTDFSTNSKGAIKYALNLAKQSKNVEVVFFHAIQIIQPTQWNETYFYIYKDEEKKRLSTYLHKFVNTIIGKEKEAFTKIKFVIETCIATDNEIIKYAENNNIDYICIATEGAGMLKKIWGTHTSYIVNNSKIPILVIPSHYRAKPLKKATYLSDFENFKNELTLISKFSNEISLQLEVLHYTSIVLEQNKFEKNLELLKNKEFENIKLNIQKNNLELSLIEKIKKYIKKSKPELLIMFTNREKGFFESIFLPSKSAELTFSSKVPMLIFSK
jgi:nucleotide-binding universal stress UspA family protein